MNQRRQLLFLSATGSKAEKYSSIQMVEATVEGLDVKTIRGTDKQGSG